MVDNQHKKISGYRDLSEQEIELMNRIKELAEQCGELVEKVEVLSTYSDSELCPDGRSVALAKTNLQQGFIWLVRSVAQPTTFG